MMQHTINAQFWFGDVVYLKVNDDRRAGMVTRVAVAANDSVTYEVTWILARAIVATW